VGQLTTPEAFWLEEPISFALQALLAQHRCSAQLESQARAVEYGQIFQYGELRTQLLEHMPPLDAAAYARTVAASGTLNSAPAALVRQRTSESLVKLPHMSSRDPAAASSNAMLPCIFL
jgi:hypothetical protein